MFNRTRQCHLYADAVVALGRRVRHIVGKKKDTSTVASQIDPKQNIINGNKIGDEREEI